MARVWQKLRSLFTSSREMERKSPVAEGLRVVALIVSEEDRSVLSKVSSQEAWDIRFVESGDEARAIAERLAAPVILFDRDWPGIEWKSSVESLAALPQHACVILVSGVADGYLWQELVSRDGYDILPKPLRTEDVLRVVKLAQSYWTISAPRDDRNGRRLQKVMR